MRSELFEETLKQHKDGLIDELEQLGKHRQAQLVAWDIEQNESDYEFYFNAAWQEQQAIINNLKAQLNNMKACYIEKKKEVEALQEQIDQYEKLTTSIRNEFDLWSDDSEFADVIEAQIENLEALRCAND